MNKSTQIKQIPVRDLIPYINNAKKHPESQVLKIAASISEFGFNNPILTDGKNGVIAGHGRLMAAQKLGIDTVPVIELSHLSEAQKKAYILADNRLAELAEWDNELLKIELETLAELDFDLSLTGFDDFVLDNDGTGEFTEGLTDEDAVPEEPVEPRTKMGDVWLCGNHRVMCGDSTNVDDMAQLMLGNLADMWLTDPPYNVAYTGCTADVLTIKNDSMKDSDFRQFLRDCYATADSFMKAGAVFYIWFADVETYNFAGALVDNNWKLSQMLIWVKHTLVMGRKDYHFKHEPCLYGWKEGAAHFWNSDRKQTTVLEFKKPMRNGEHPTMKPVELFEYQMLNNTKKNDIVLDSFGGSGTTMIAAEKNGRVARLMELDEKYCDVIVKRWQEFTGKQATLESTGEPFNESKA